MTSWWSGSGDHGCAVMSGFITQGKRRGLDLLIGWGKMGFSDTLAGCVAPYRGGVRSGPHTFPSRRQEGIAQLAKGGGGDITMRWVGWWQGSGNSCPGQRLWVLSPWRGLKSQHYLSCRVLVSRSKLLHVEMPGKNEALNKILHSPKKMIRR